MDDTYRQKMIAILGEAGKIWLESISGVIAEYEVTWGFKASPPYNLSYNYVAPVILHDGSPAVLKIGFPEDKEFRYGIEALNVFDGQGACRVLKEDLERGVALLEKVTPGDILLTVKSDEEAIRIGTNVMKRLWKKPQYPSQFPTIVDLGKGFGRHREKFAGTSGPLPKELFDRAEKTYIEFAQSVRDRIVLHGDLHQANILSSERDEWLAIDPKGILGEPAYEVGSLLRNPKQLAQSPDLTTILEKRIEVFVRELGFARERIIGWGMSQAVLSAIWSIEDNEEHFEDSIVFAQTLSAL